MSNSSWHGGKGHSPRKVVNKKQFEDNWDLIFGKKESIVEEPEDTIIGINKEIIIEDTI
tara:strand:- start:2833 stop:3009 length:177 start_codon:yes stop_codon:yes gene_type:complete